MSYKQQKTFGCIRNHCCVSVCNDNKESNRVSNGVFESEMKGDKTYSKNRHQQS